MKQETWQTRDGLVIRISEMNDTHLINAIAFVFKEAAKDRNNLVRVEPEPTNKRLPERAGNTPDKAIILRDITTGWAILVSDKMPHLIAEAKKRGLGMPVYFTDHYITHSDYYGPNYCKDSGWHDRDDYDWGDFHT